VSRLLGTNTNSLKIRHTMQKNMVYLTEKITATTHATIDQLFFLGLQGLPLCLELRLPAIVINLRRAAIYMQGCFALAIIDDFRKVSWQLPQGIATSEIDQRDMGSDISASEPLSINHSLFVFSAHPFDCGTAGSFSPKQSQPFWTEANDRAASDSIL
jgi:hypothetical protein